MTRCIRCGLDVGAGRALVNHLVAYHLMPPEQAVREAVSPPEESSNVDAKTILGCKLCARKAPEKCGYHGGAKKPTAVKRAPATTSNGHGGAIDRALAELRGERERLDGAIAALEALAE